MLLAEKPGLMQNFRRSCAGLTTVGAAGALFEPSVGVDGMVCASVVVLGGLKEITFWILIAFRNQMVYASFCQNRELKFRKSNSCSELFIPFKKRL